MKAALDNPLVFILVMTTLILAVAHLSHAAAKLSGNQMLVRFTGLPSD